MRRFIKVTLLGIGILLIIAQLIPRHWNTTSAPQPNDISRVYSVPPNVTALLKNSCYDCHSNNTRYPWYANIQPVRYMLDRHISEGKDELNFNEFGTYSSRKKRSKLRSIGNSLEEKSMPLKSYLLIHHSAELSAQESTVIQDWLKNVNEADEK
ncbi:heme-binding domain-containing protein [Mucilaginibacter defluvii]|uniref:Heme-binding domain-containing protein n=1 Tax=Mucilaginibacter defluvii TaxID=1196019 RepID=A0ABP9FWX6_9SPHI